MSTHRDAVHAQFNARASAYLTSSVHAAGPDLRRAHELVSATSPRPVRALDLGCGAGHLSFALSPLVGSVVALDPSDGMLAQVATEAVARGLTNIATMRSDAESVPYPDACFDLVATRYSAHHWTDLDAAIAEVRRVLAPGGHVLVIDIEAPADALSDSHLQTIELLRDRSHVRNRSDAEWQALLRRIDVDIIATERWGTRLEFASWVARMGTSEAKANVIRTVLDEAPAEVRNALHVEVDGSFRASTALWWGRLLT